MNVLIRLFCLLFLTATASAADVRYGSVKPDVIIDVRTPAEYAAGHVDGAINIPHDRIAEGIFAIRGLKKESTILLYCRSGRRSAMARAVLEQQGFNRVTDGGDMTSLVRDLKTCTAGVC